MFSSDGNMVADEDARNQSEAGTSVEAQTKNIRALLQGVESADIIIDDGGKSAKDLKRPGIVTP